jgi:5'-3' exonuclease
MVNVHLIDGTYELFRSYFGAPSSKNAAGEEVGATRGLLNSLAALLRRDDVTHVACAFDHVIESFRNDLYAGYKTGEGIEPELKAQFPMAEDAVRALGLTVWPMVEFEADDALASGAARFRDAPEVERVIICTPDKDLAQCVLEDRVVCWDRARDRVTDADGVRDRFGVSPASIPDYLALVGDSADGIPGIPKWGAKSAAAVLSRYAHLEGIPENVDTWDVKVRGAKTLSANLEAAREDARLFRTLATLREDVELTETLPDLEWRGAERKLLQQFADRVGDTKIVGRVGRFHD